MSLRGSPELRSSRRGLAPPLAAEHGEKARGLLFTEKKYLRTPMSYIPPTLPTSRSRLSIQPDGSIVVDGAEASAVGTEHASRSVSFSAAETTEPRTAPRPAIVRTVDYNDPASSATWSGLVRCGEHARGAGRRAPVVEARDGGLRLWRTKTHRTATGEWISTSSSRASSAG